MNTAEKVARLEAYLQRLQTNAKLPHPRRAKPLRMDVAARAEPQVEAASPIAGAAHAAVLELEAQRSAAERGANEAAERAAKEAAELAAQARALEQAAAREAAERAAAEKAAKDAAEKAAKDAAEKAVKDAAERAAKEKAAKEAVERAAAEKAAKEKAAAEKAAADKAAADKAAKEAADKAAADKAAKEAADKAAKEKAAEKAAADKAAKDAAERAAREKAAKDAVEKAEKAAADKASKEKAAKEAAEKAAKERAAAAAPKRQPSTIDELFEDLELGGDTKVGPAELTPAASAALAPAASKALTPSPLPVRAAVRPLPDAVKDEPTFDAAEQPTVVADRSLLAQAAEAPAREQRPALAPDAPTRVAEAFPSVIESSNAEVPVIDEDSAALDRSPEADEPTVIRFPSAHDQALARGDVADEKSTGDEEPTIIRNVSDEAPTVVAPKDEPIKAAPIISVGEPSEGDAEDKGAASKSGGALHEPKVALAEPLREAAEREAAERAEKAAQEAALRPKREPQERDEVTTASRRVVQLTPEAIEEERRKREEEDKGKKKGWGTTVGLVAVTALLVGAAWFVGLREGWFSSGGPPSPSTPPTQGGPDTKPTADGPRTTGAAPTGAPTSAQTVQPTATPTASVSAEPTAAPTSAPTVAPGTPAPPPVPVVEKDEASAKLNATKGFLTVTAPEDLSVFVTGRKIGQTNQRHEISCGVGLIRLGTSLPSGGIEWRSAPGLSISIPCRASTSVAVPPSAGPWPTPGRAPAPGGGGDPY